PRTLDGLLQPALESGRSASKRSAARFRLLVAELAIRAYRLERGDAPDSLESLVTAYLSAVPVDPYSPRGEPLIYRKARSGSLLYSAGPDGVDDGGTPFPERMFATNPAGDVLVEMVDEPR